MKVLFVASEMTPLAKVGGLGDVMGSLPKALVQIGIETSVIIPLYEQIDRIKWRLKRLGGINVGQENTIIYYTEIPAGDTGKVRIFLIENRRYLSRGPIYFDRTAFMNSRKELERFLFFSRAVFEFVRRRDFFQPDIVHCNDWHSGALVVMLQNQNSNFKNQNLKTVFTIHNLANQGAFGGRNLMEEGIENADMVTTVSPSYAKEILTKEFGEGLENLLRRRDRKKELAGILNGIDYEFWPLAKREKLVFQKKIGLKQDIRSPIFGFVARLTSQKGVNLIIPLVRKLVEENGAQFVFLGQGEADYEKNLLKLGRDYRDLICTKIGFDEKLAHDIYAQSDFFLMPSIFEPSGLGQMISMRYGTIPIVRATGGLRDSVRHLKTGFVFEKANSGVLFDAIKLALRYFNHPAKMKKMIKNCQNQDFSWNKSAKKYRKLYESIK
ncbi:hypothetical protein A2608_02215 [Candidatus Azambacteria bacterium RIFOXYD1_FULL_44_10]|nr:MAG: hypothetical protein A2608_02215 [Candidatus Azambacteria bacterium RIFOXYD1_FULL_44_10]